MGDEKNKGMDYRGVNNKIGGFKIRGLFQLLKAGTIESLIDHLVCCPALGDDAFLVTFFSTYRTFILPYQVLGWFTYSTIRIINVK